MARTLFMASENHLNILLLMKHVENLQNDATGKRKDCLDTFPFEAFDENLSTCELHDRTSIHTASNNLIEESGEGDTAPLVPNGPETPSTVIQNILKN
jgi:hypothetical protein